MIHIFRPPVNIFELGFMSVRKYIRFLDYHSTDNAAISLSVYISRVIPLSNENSKCHVSQGLLVWVFFTALLKVSSSSPLCRLMMLGRWYIFAQNTDHLLWFWNPTRAVYRLKYKKKKKGKKDWKRRSKSLTVWTEGMT